MRHERLRRAREAGRPDGLVRFLRAAGLGAIRVRLVRDEVGAVAPTNHVTRLGHRARADRHRVGAHVGDEADLALGQRHALIQRLGDAHRAPGAKAQLARGLLLERAGGERRRRALLLLAARNLGDLVARLAQRSLVRLRLLLGADAGLLAVDAGQLRREARLGLGAAQLGGEGPVLLRHEALDLALAVDHQPNGHALHPPGRQAAPDLAADQRAELVAHQPIDDAPRLLGVHQVEVDAARVGEGLIDRALGDLAERHPLQAVRRQLGVLGDMPGDRFALAIEVGGKPHLVGATRLVGQLVELLAAVLQRLVAQGEVMVHVHAQALLRQVTDMAIGRQHGVAGAQVSLDGLGLGGRLDDHQVARGTLPRRHRSGSVAPGLSVAAPRRRRCGRGCRRLRMQRIGPRQAIG